MSTMTTQLDVPNKLLFTVGEVAELFIVTRKTVYRWVNEGLMGAYTFKRKENDKEKKHQPIRITRQEIVSHLEKYRSDSA